MLRKNNILWIVPLVLLVIGTLAVVAFNQDDKQPGSGENTNIEKSLDKFYLEIYEQSAPAIVSVKSLSTIQRDKTVDATGFVINESGYVLTAFENVKDSKTIIAKYSDGSVEMSVFKADEAAGWVILKPIKEQSKRIYMNLAQNQKIKLADACISLSNVLNSIALTGKPAIKTGEVTSISAKTETLPELIETSFDLGNSGIGSPLLNADGQVIGMCIGYKKAGRWLTTAVPVSTFIDAVNGVK